MKIPLLAALLLVCAGMARAQGPDAADWKAAEVKVNMSEAPDAKEMALRTQQDEATGLLAKAVKAMEGKVWRVDGRIDGRSMSLLTGTWGDWGPTGTLAGLVSGKDFDLRATGFPLGDLRQIGIGDKMWNTRDRPARIATPARIDTRSVSGRRSVAGGGKAWVTDSLHPDLPYYFLMVGLPLPVGVPRLQFEQAGKEQHEDGTWLHMAAGGEDYWILLDKNGAPAQVRRITTTWNDPFINLMRVLAYKYTLDFALAKEGERIMPPEGGPARREPMTNDQ